MHGPHLCMPVRHAPNPLPGTHADVGPGATICMIHVNGLWLVNCLNGGSNRAANEKMRIGYWTGCSQEIPRHIGHDWKHKLWVIKVLVTPIECQSGFSILGLLFSTFYMGRLTFSASPLVVLVSDYFTKYAPKIAQSMYNLWYWILIWCTTSSIQN